MKSRSCYKFSLALTVLCVLGSAPAVPAETNMQSYTITDLGTFSGGTYSSAYGNNNKGQVVGHAEMPNASPLGAGSHAFLYNDGSLQDLSTLPNDNYRIPQRKPTPRRSGTRVAPLGQSPRPHPLMNRLRL